MRFISNGFYFFIAIIAILWSFVSTFERGNSLKQEKYAFSSENSTSIKMIEYSDSSNIFYLQQVFFLNLDYSQLQNLK